MHVLFVGRELRPDDTKRWKMDAKGIDEGRRGLEDRNTHCANSERHVVLLVVLNGPVLEQTPYMPYPHIPQRHVSRD